MGVRVGKLNELVDVSSSSDFYLFVLGDDRQN